MLTVPAGGGLLAEVGALELALVLVCGGFEDELCDDGAAAVELCVLLVGADGVREAVRLPDVDSCGVPCAGDVRGAPLVRVTCPLAGRDDDGPAPGGATVVLDAATDEVTAIPAMPADTLDRVAELFARLAVVRADVAREEEADAGDDVDDAVGLADTEVLCTGSATSPIVNGGWCWPRRTMTIPATTNASTIATARRDCWRRCSGVAAGNPRRCDDDIAAQC
jgi:hypothetical protein